MFGNFKDFDAKISQTLSNISISKNNRDTVSEKVYSDVINNLLVDEK
jgi:hypothetical protein